MQLLLKACDIYSINKRSLKKLYIQIFRAHESFSFLKNHKMLAELEGVGASLEQRRGKFFKQGGLVLVKG